MNDEILVGGIDGATEELRRSIREAFASEPVQSAERLDLARKAGAMIPLARKLGLTGLAELCLRLEQKCTDDSDIFAVYWAAKAAAFNSICQATADADCAVYMRSLPKSTH